MSDKGWIGCDLDGTLAHYDGWKGAEHIGAPIPVMIDRVKRWLAAGHTVKIFTARVYGFYAGDGTVSFEEAQRVVKAIDLWTMEHLGVTLPVTCIKDYGMIELWDDRAVQVQANTGIPYGPSTRGLD